MEDNRVEMANHKSELDRMRKDANEKDADLTASRNDNDKMRERLLMSQECQDELASLRRRMPSIHQYLSEYPRIIKYVCFSAELADTNPYSEKTSNSENN